MRRFILVVTCILLGLNFSQTALSAEEILLFGPETFTRERGRPVREVRTFSVLSPCLRTTLSIFNGDANGDFRVSSTWTNYHRGSGIWQAWRSTSNPSLLSYGYKPGPAMTPR